MEGPKIKVIRCVEWPDDVVAGKWCEVGSCLFLGTPEALCLVLTTAAVASSVAFRSAAEPGLRWRELVFGSCLPRPTNGRRLAGIGELRENH